MLWIRWAAEAHLTLGIDVAVLLANDTFLLVLLPPRLLTPLMCASGFAGVYTT